MGSIATMIIFLLRLIPSTHDAALIGKIFLKKILFINFLLNKSIFEYCLKLFLKNKKQYNDSSVDL
jgi:hypothetical protein